MAEEEGGRRAVGAKWSLLLIDSTLTRGVLSLCDHLAISVMEALLEDLDVLEPRVDVVCLLAPCHRRTSCTQSIACSGRFRHYREPIVSASQLEAARASLPVLSSFRSLAELTRYRTRRHITLTGASLSQVRVETSSRVSNAPAFFGSLICAPTSLVPPMRLITTHPRLLFVPHLLLDPAD